MRIGVLGGTFDPIHMGHLIIAEDVREKLSLSKIIFIPAGNPWMKEKISDKEKRFEMTKLAIKNNPFFEISRMEIEREGPSYTVDTLRILKKKYEEIYFIAGYDSVSSLPRWKNPDEILRLAFFVGVRRPGCERPDIDELSKSIPGAKEKIILLDTPLIEISSTDIRERVRKGLSIKYLVPPEVEEYIKREGLYAR